MSDEHRRTATLWHGGQSSPLYAFASTGTVVPGIDHEIWDCVAIVERGELGVDADPVEEHERLLALLHHVEPEVAIGKAREVGREHGENAAAWWQQDALGGRATGDTASTARRVLQGLDDGDPVILDTLPGWVDGYTATDLQGDCDWPEPDFDDRDAHRRWDTVLSDLWSAYQTARHDAVRESVIRSCERELADAGTTPDGMVPGGPDPGRPRRPHGAPVGSLSPGESPEPFLRAVATSTAGVFPASARPTPPGWITEHIGRWNGAEHEIVYDPRRFEVAVTSPDSVTTTAALDATGWDHQATDGERGLWTRDRVSAARAALARYDQRAVGIEATGPGPTAEAPDVTRGLEL
jgi:hypothetical protein